MKTTPLTTNHTKKDRKTMRTPRRIQTLLSCGIALAATFGMATAVAGAETLPAAEKPEKASVGAVVEGNTTFALKMYQELSSKEGNLFFSPYSISTAFAMTYAGARNNTEGIQI